MQITPSTLPSTGLKVARYTQAVRFGQKSTEETVADVFRKSGHLGSVILCLEARGLAEQGNVEAARAILDRVAREDRAGDKLNVFENYITGFEGMLGKRPMPPDWDKARQLLGEIVRTAPDSRIEYDIKLKAATLVLEAANAADDTNIIPPDERAAAVALAEGLLENVAARGGRYQKQVAGLYLSGTQKLPPLGQFKGFRLLAGYYKDELTERLRYGFF